MALSVNLQAEIIMLPEIIGRTLTLFFPPKYSNLYGENSKKYKVIITHMMQLFA
jgi:hypothetical protein